MFMVAFSKFRNGRLPGCSSRINKLEPSLAERSLQTEAKDATTYSFKAVDILGRHFSSGIKPTQNFHFEILVCELGMWA